MAKKHGRRGMVYIGVASSSATAEPVANIKKWGLARKTNKPEVTTLEDANNPYLAGLPDCDSSL